MEEVSLVIKAANQKYDDVKINCNLSWTILDLKNHLSVHYPSRPKITEQRIIYSGHLLTDDQLIRSIIQMSNDITTSNVYTFHLVCPQQKPVSNNTTSDNLNNQKTSSDSIPNSNMAADAFPTNQSLNQLSAHMGPDTMLMQESYQVLMNQYYQYMSYYMLSAPPIDFASYAAFTNAYMQSFNPNAITNNSPAVGNVENPSNRSANNSVTAVANENVENDRVDLGNNNNNMINNRINLANNNDDLINRDWTDWMYSFSKAIVMLSIIYFYSSLNRLVLFVSIFFIIYFYKNLLNGIHHPNVAGVEEPIDRAGNNNNNNVNATNVRQREDSQPENSENNDNNNDNELAPDRDRYYSCVRFLWVFFTSLFTSLIPDPVPIN